MTLITKDNFAIAMTILNGHDEIAVDTEASGLNVRNRVDYLMGFCFATEDYRCYMPFRHPDTNLPLSALPHIEDLLRKKDLIWHNAKFDYHSVKTIGIDPLKFTGKLYDTMVISHLVNEEWYSHELDALGKKFLGVGKEGGEEFHKLGKLFGYDKIPATIAAPYGEQDAWLTFKLKEILWKELAIQDLEQVYWDTEAPYIKLLYELEQRGVGVDQHFANEKADRGLGRMSSIKRELHLNPASPIDLGEYLIKELELPVLAHTGSCEMCKAGFKVDTHHGKPSFNKHVMEDYDDILQSSSNPNPAARLIGEFRGWQKAVSSLYLPVIEKVGPDGLIRTDFRQTGTVTGRSSASDPNLQQVPRGSSKPWNGDAKSSFTSGRPEFKLYGWDYSQLELRIAAAYGVEGLLLTEFEKDDADPFAILAPLIFGKLTPQTRQDTKTFVYANLYGAGLPKIAAQLGRSVESTRPLFRRYKDSIQGIMAVSTQVTDLVAQRGYTRYWDGRRRHIRDRTKAYKAWNSVCQGGGAQLVKKAMLRLQPQQDENFQMVLQVHDEITFIIRENMIKDYEPIVIEAMTDWPQFNVRLHIEGKEWR